MALNRSMLISVALLALVALNPSGVRTTASPSEPQTKPILNVLSTTPLTGDSNRVVRIVAVTFPPGSDSGLHHHLGDQYTYLIQGELHSVIDGKDVALKQGEAAHIDPVIVHRTVNQGQVDAKTIEFFIVEKDKPNTIKD